jgi:hypothetical protein
MRGRNKALHSTGLCSKESGLLRCYVECDGGGVKVSIRSNHVMMYLDRIRVAECGKELTVDGDDNKISAVESTTECFVSTELDVEGSGARIIR